MTESDQHSLKSAAFCPDDGSNWPLIRNLRASPHLKIVYTIIFTLYLDVCHLPLELLIYSHIIGHKRNQRVTWSSVYSANFPRQSIYHLNTWFLTTSCAVWTWLFALIFHVFLWPVNHEPLLRFTYSSQPNTSNTEHYKVYWMVQGHSDKGEAYGEFCLFSICGMVWWPI